MFLKHEHFEDLSSATIRNYFVQLEEEGFLTQAHTSGGRIPTRQGFKVYASESLDEMPSILTTHDEIKKLPMKKLKNLQVSYHLLLIF